MNLFNTGVKYVAFWGYCYSPPLLPYLTLRYCLSFRTPLSFLKVNKRLAIADRTRSASYETCHYGHVNSFSNLFVTLTHCNETNCFTSRYSIYWVTSLSFA